MFTGLIEDIGRIAAFERRAGAGVLRVNTSLPLQDIALGDSIAVNGACLTVTSKSTSTLTFDVSPESLSSTTLGTLAPGSSVNLEQALRLGARMGGHMVTGHIDCLARLSRLQTVSGNKVLDFTLPVASLRYLVPKGSVAIDGISLTVNTVSNDGFSVNIIPHTFSRTTLAAVAIGQTVNIETDIIGKYIEKMILPWKPGGGLSMQTLAENGFL